MSDGFVRPGVDDLDGAVLAAGGEEGGVGAVGERADGLGEAHDVGFKLAGDAPGEELDEVVVGARGEGLAVRGHREDVHGVLDGRP